MFKNFFLRKKNIEKRIRNEVAKARLELQKEHDKEIREINKAHLGVKRETALILDFEATKIEENTKIIYEDKLAAKNDEIKALKIQNTLAQELWEGFCKEHMELGSICSRLQKKAMLDIENEKIEHGRILADKAQKLKQYEHEGEFLERMFRKMKKVDGQNVKLVALQDEEEDK